MKISGKGISMLCWWYCHFCNIRRIHIQTMLNVTNNTFKEFGLNINLITTKNLVCYKNKYHNYNKYNTKR